ncbi:ABC transporter ATP-binding protein [Tepidimicrobium xylanilyticum]|uniref:ABC-type quaternary amine transporter n=1 Tax=Tepidimicrobium xylanilyticum TaxID=1123352 RepID=A0A1H3B690_9FIRM|nr:ABC transporter ATP-binding protein [Tepidimicrobium xylanilyticum]GMG96986.1 ABC transporter ATP-binding protein [Tepidimicrobium xylanilyticum]SDX37423.1 iron(III) transport system ATP-binding protein [Tepidimicrobium xylanilyticum]
MFVKLENVTKTFNEVIAVDRLSFKVEKGQIMCLLGPSGCGKTTTLKSIGGFLKINSGRIIIDGQDITNLPPEIRPTSTVFQSYALFPHMTVLQNVIYGLKFKGYSRKEAIKKGEEYLEIVGLLPYRNRNVQQLSGGQQQRVALARALVVTPKVLLLDEPLSNLDAKLRVKMREEIKDIQSQLGITMIFVTHDQEEALYIADIIAVMNEGKLEQIGTPQEVYCNPKSKFVLDFIGNSNVIEESSGSISFVRPEEIIMDRHQGNTYGKVVKRKFIGSYISYVVQTEKNKLNVQAQNVGNEGFELGEYVYLTYKERYISLEKHSNI